jgi:hypothetical protein
MLQFPLGQMWMLKFVFVKAPIDWINCLKDLHRDIRFFCFRLD